MKSRKKAASTRTVPDGGTASARKAEPAKRGAKPASRPPRRATAARPSPAVKATRAAGTRQANPPNAPGKQPGEGSSPAPRESKVVVSPRVKPTAKARERPTGAPPAPPPTTPLPRVPDVQTSVNQVQPGLQPTAALEAERPVRAQSARPFRARRPPPILFEGDDAPAPALSGPGQRFVLGPKPAVDPVNPNSTGLGLPVFSGSARLWLTARDPHWLYASWDLSAGQIAELEARAPSGHLTLRLYDREVGAAPLFEVPLATAARSWFVHVGRAAARYVAELGSNDREHGWQTILTSNVADTPPEAPAAPEASAVEFATIPVDVPFAVILGKVAEAARQDAPLAQAIEALRTQGFDLLPGPAAVREADWTPARDRALAEVLRVDSAGHVWVSSLDVTALVARELGGAPEEPGAGSWEQPTSPTSPAVAFNPESGGVSSPSGEGIGRDRPRGFWFNVNAELVIYGATEPDAQVTIAGKAVKLRPDGSFSLRFALPDGHYELPVRAVARAGDDGRSAALEFSRRTDYQGEVGAHPQDAQLRPPRPEGIPDAGPHGAA